MSEPTLSTRGSHWSTCSAAGTRCSTTSGAGAATSTAADRRISCPRQRLSVGPDGSIAEWVIGDGLAWGAAQLDEWMSALLELADGLGSPPLTTYLEERGRLLATEWRALQPSLAALRRLAWAMR